MDQGDGYQTVSALGVGQKKIGMRFGITNAELFCMQWTGKTYTKDGTTKEISESKRKFQGYISGMGDNHERRSVCVPDL